MEEEETTKGEEEKHPPPPSILVFTACVFPPPRKEEEERSPFYPGLWSKREREKKIPLSSSAPPPPLKKNPRGKRQENEVFPKDFPDRERGGRCLFSLPPLRPKQLRGSGGKEEGDGGQNYPGIEREGILFSTELYFAHVLTGTGISLQEDDYNNFD